MSQLALSAPASRWRFSVFTPVVLGLLVLGFGWSLFVGSDFEMGWIDVWHWLIGATGNEIHQHIIKEVRLPRVLCAVGVGASLAVAGLLMQALTRNPIASPSVFGVSAGASFAFAFASTGLIGWFSALPILVVTFIGASIAGLAVFFLAGLHQHQVNPVRVVLAGVALNFLFLSLTRAAVILADESAYGVMHWITGTIANVDWSHVQVLYWSLLVGLAAALYLSYQLNLLALGESMMKNLGGKLALVRIGTSLTLILLIAASVSVAGPIAFIGLVIPHLSRSLVGHDLRLLVPVCALLGANLLVYADAITQLLARGSESPVGILTNFIGASFFLLLAKKQVKKQYA